jgi:peroxiredoxin
VRVQWLILLAVAAAAAGAGYFLSRTLDPGVGDGPAGAANRHAAPLAEDLLGQRRPDFTLLDAGGTPVSAGDFDSQALLINFWASWCKPCIEEMPMLSDLQRDHAGNGLQVIGIALDDPQRAEAFAADLGLEYPLLYGLADAAGVGRRYGNREGMLPYSVLVDARGMIRWTKLGALTRDELDAQLAELR